MLGHLLKRLAQNLITLLVVVTATFMLLRFAPGSPFSTDRDMPPEVLATLNAKYHLDQPLIRQYFYWLGSLAHGDLGNSFQFMEKPVTEVLADSATPSLLLGLAALVISIVGGVFLGVLAAWKKDRWPDHLIGVFLGSMVSIPPYLLAVALIFVFSVYLGLLPGALWQGPEYLILPALTLALRPLALVGRLTRATIIDVLGADYIRTAYAKGLDTRTVLFKHALKNAALPVVTLLGPITANLLTGSFIVELIFQIPGLGKHFVSAVLNRDFPLVTGLTLFYGVVLISANWIVDVVYGWIDPRVRS